MANKVSFIIQLKNKFGSPAKAIDRQFIKMERSAERLNKRLEKQKKKFKNIGDFGKRTAKQGAVATAAITAPIVLMAKSMADAASNAVETRNKFNAVFDDVKDKANKVADSFSKNFGVAKTTAREMIGDTGDLLVGFGFTGDAALKMASDVARLSSDLTSFQNFAGGSKNASIALTKALLGESEAAKALGIVVRQGTPEFKKNVKQIMRSRRVNLLQAKAIEILRIATSQSQKAIGDIQRTWEDHESVVRRNAEASKEMKESFGKLLLPMFTKGTRIITGVVKWLTNLSPPMKTLVIGVAGFLAVGGPLLLLLGGIAFAVSAISAPVLLVGAAILGLGAIIAAVVLNWDSLVKFILGGAAKILAKLSEFAGAFGLDTLSVKLQKASAELLVKSQPGGTISPETVQSRTAPTAPVKGAQSTLTGAITVAAEKGSRVVSSVLSTAGDGLNIGMNVPAGAN